MSFPPILESNPENGKLFFNYRVSVITQLACCLLILLSSLMPLIKLLNCSGKCKTADKMRSQLIWRRIPKHNQHFIFYDCSVSSYSEHTFASSRILNANESHTLYFRTNLPHWCPGLNTMAIKPAYFLCVKIVSGGVSLSSPHYILFLTFCLGTMQRKCFILWMERKLCQGTKIKC